MEWELAGEQRQEEASREPTAPFLLPDGRLNQKQYHIPRGTAVIRVTVQAVKDGEMVVSIISLFNIYLVREKTIEVVENDYGLCYARLGSCCRLQLLFWM